MYGGEEFARIVQQYRDMVDQAIQQANENTTEEEASSASLLNRMEYHFHKCCQLEHMFWDQAESCMEWPI
jgi:thiaminase